MNRVVAVTLLVFAACAAEDPGEPSECGESGRYMRLATGASWTYAVSGGKTKTQTVGAIEDVGGAKAGTMAHRMTTTKSGGGMTISWQQDTGASVVRHREQDLSGTNHTDEIYSPGQTRIDETAAHIVVGATWTESYDEIVSSLTRANEPTTMARKVDTWAVIAIDEQVDVPAGRFCSLHVQRRTQVGSNPPKTKHFWFARGVGKVKEKDDKGDVEELSTFSQP
ncbi:MAG: hypothetical protein M4D80_33515 [Myxococcota bacterium]|nr:hypothetical protein [Deltaproteobacteria bacterium]MDQ3340104.1 hypothetical protein [Myxococcota bacterium]